MPKHLNAAEVAALQAIALGATTFVPAGASANDVIAISGSDGLAAKNLSELKYHGFLVSEDTEAGRTYVLSSAGMYSLGLQTLP